VYSRTGGADSDRGQGWQAPVGITVIGYLHTYVGQKDQAREPRATKIKKLEEDDQGTVMTNISIRERSLALDQLNRAFA